MNCQRAKGFFSEFFDGRLETRVADLLDDHLNECAECSKAYADYDRFFTALRSVPSIRTERPAPLPETATAFMRRPAKPSLARRMATAAAVLLMIGGAAHLGYRWGSDAPPISRNSPLVSTADILPMPEAGGRVRRSSEGVGNLALLSNRAKRVPDSDRAANAVSSVLQFAPLANDADALLAMRDEELGSYAGSVRRYAGEVKSVLSDMRQVLRDSRPTKERLEKAWMIVEKSSLPSRLAEIEPMARRFEPTPYEDPMTFGVNPLSSSYPEDRQLIIGCLRSCAGQRDANRVFDEYFLKFPNSPLSPIALELRVAQDGGRSALNMQVPKELVDLFESAAQSDIAEAPQWKPLFDKARIVFRRIQISNDRVPGSFNIVVPIPGPKAIEVHPAPPAPAAPRSNSKL